MVSQGRGAGDSFRSHGQSSLSQAGFSQRAPLESPLPGAVPAGRVLLGATPAATTEIATFNGIELCLAKMTSFIEAFGFLLLFLVF